MAPTEPEALPRSPSPRRILWTVGLLTALTMLATVDRNILALLLDPIKSDLGLTEVQVSTLVGVAFALVYTLAALPAGWAADRLSRRGIVFAAAGVWCLGTALSGVFGAFGPLFAARFITGLGEGFLGPAAQALIRASTPTAWRGRAFAGLAVAPLMGAGAATLVGGVLLRALPHGGLDLPVIGLLRPWQSVLLILGGLGLPLAALALTLPKTERRSSAAAAERRSWSAAVRYMGEHRRIYVPLLAFIVSQYVIAAINGAWAPTLLRRIYGFQPLQIGLTLGLMLLIFGPIGAVLSGSVLDRLQARFGKQSLPAMALVVSVIGGLTSIFAPLMPSAWLFFGLLVIQIPLHVLPAAITSVAIARITPQDFLGRVVGVQYLVTGVIASTFGPTIVAVLTQHVFGGRGGVAPALATVSLAATLVSIAGCLGFRRPYMDCTMSH